MIADEIRNLDRVRCYTDAWAFFLAREFERRGVELRFDPLRENGGAAAVDHYRRLDVSDIDHVLALGLRYWSKLPPLAAGFLMGRIPGAVTQYAERPVDGHPCDATFVTHSPQSDDSVDNVYVGWAADSSLFVPDQSHHALSLLVDHPNYGTDPQDRTLATLRECWAMIKVGVPLGGFRRVVVRRLVDGGAIEVDPATAHVEPFNRQHVSIGEIAGEYGRAHVFFVTHRESTGLVVLEAAMSGALVVAPEGYIASDRLRTVRAIEYRERIPWRRVVDEIDVPASRSRALPNDWAAVADRMLEWLTRFKR